MTTVGSGTTLIITSGQTIDGVIVLKGGLLRVLSGGTVRNTLNDTGYDLIEFGGSAINTTVAGTISLFPSGFGIEAGTEYVASGGTAIGATLHAGFQEVYGNALDTKVNWGGVQWVFSGGIATGTILNGGVELFSGVLLFSNATQNVFAGGTAIDTIVNTDGQLNVGSGGVATGATLNGGHAFVGYGATANGTIVNAGGFFGVNGTAIATTINSGGGLTVNDGTIVDTSINIGGLAAVYTGTLNGTTAINDGTLELSSGAVVVNGVVDLVGSNGTLILDEAISLSTPIYDFDALDKIKLAANHFDPGGFPRFDNGGSLTPGSGNVLHVVENRAAYSVQFDPLQDFSGQAFELVPNYDGVNLFLGHASNILPGQSISNTSLNSGNIQNVFGAANGITISSQAYQNVELGGTAIGTIIQAGGFQEVLGGGSAIEATILGGNQVVLLGGEALDSTINGGVQQVYGTARQTSANSGYVFVYSGGTAIDTTLNNGAFEFVEYGGTATGTLVNSGGFLAVEGGGTLFGITINSGGIANVESGKISDPTINDGTFDSTIWRNSRGYHPFCRQWWHT